MQQKYNSKAIKTDKTHYGQCDVRIQTALNNATLRNGDSSQPKQQQQQ